MFLGLFLKPFTEILGQSDQLQKDSLLKRDESKVVSECAILTQKGAII